MTLCPYARILLRRARDNWAFRRALRDMVGLPFWASHRQLVTEIEAYADDGEFERVMGPLRGVQCP